MALLDQKGRVGLLHQMEARWAQEVVQRVLNIQRLLQVEGKEDSLCYLKVEGKRDCFQVEDRESQLMVGKQDCFQVEDRESQLMVGKQDCFQVEGMQSSLQILLMDLD